MEISKFKKIFIICIVFACSGCTVKNIKTMTYEEIISDVTSSSADIYNVNNKGYRYYLPASMTIKYTDNFNQIFLYNKDMYYLYVDAVSYYNKEEIKCENNRNSYYFNEFIINDKKGYINILKNNDDFYVEIMYNYAIIEVKVEEKNINEAIVKSASILSSIKYNYLVVENLIKDNMFESKITKYEIFGPDNKEEKNYLEIYGTNDNSLDKIEE